MIMTEPAQFIHWVILSAYGEGAPVALKLKQEGKDVVLSLADDLKSVGSKEEPEERKRRLSTYDGLVEKMSAEDCVAKLLKVKDKGSYFIFCDMNCLWPYAEKLLDAGFENGLFPTKWDYEMESDREKAKEFVKKHYPDLKLAPTYEYKKIADAANFLEEDTSGNFYVLKSNSEEGKTIVPLTENLETMKRQLLGKLEKYKQDYERKGFILETRIPNPTEFTPQCVWFNGEPVFYDVDIENKPIGSGNIGYQVGAAQTFVANVHKRSRMVEMAFPKAIQSIAAKRRGLFVFDASILMDSRDGSMYFGEVCSNRMGYDSLYAELAMSRSVSGFFEDIATGINPLIRDYGAAVRMFNLPNKPGYLGDCLADKEIVLRHDANVWLMDARQEDDALLTAGYGMDFAVATGYGKHLEEAVGMAYDEIEQVGLLDAYYRPESDFLGCYKTSIPSRWGQVRWMVEEQMNSTPIS